MFPKSHTAADLGPFDEDPSEIEDLVATAIPATTTPSTVILTTVSTFVRPKKIGTIFGGGTASQPADPVDLAVQLCQVKKKKILGRKIFYSVPLSYLL
jgi:hypothetical protein